MFDAIATLIDAKAKPLTADDDRSMGERQAEALADACGYVLDRGDVPECGGRRPHLNVLIRLEDLENRARAACLDFGVAPIVLSGTGQPLDVGRITRTIPDGLRRAVAARDRGCAHPGCGRPVSWTECHHNPCEDGTGSARSLMDSSMRSAVLVGGPVSARQPAVATEIARLPGP
jgi:hypothetical protein